MARAKTKKYHVKKLPKKKLNTFQIFPKVLILIGKPFYLILSYVVIGLLLALSFIGKSFRFVVNETALFFKKSHEEIIYRAKDLTRVKKLKKKRKGKVFKVNITFFKKINFRTKIKIISVLILILAVFGFSIWYFIFRGLPSPKELISRKINVSTKIYDRNGVLLYRIYKDENRTLVNLTQIPDSVKYATLASEDAAFYSEPGFSIKGIIRAIISDITHKDFSAGGSTITQQLVKNTLLTNEKTIIRKIKELVLSIEVEQNFSKDKILEMYLNEVSYGGSAYGIEAASEQYFGKNVSQLNLAEASLLAGLPRSPTTYSPYGANPELAVERQKEVLKLMADNAFITREEMQKAQGEKLNFIDNQVGIKAPHFVMYVRQKLVDEYGEEEVEAGGLSVTTTLNYDIQRMAEDVVKTQVDKLKGFHATNGAALVLDPNTGDILAMVGSKDYFDINNDGNVNVTVALRPPGSSIKIVNYAYALSHGFTPETIISDERTSFKSPGVAPYSPVNYDGKFVGNITLRNALAQSRNIPAVKVLASYGVANMIKMGQAMGITTWGDPSQYGLSLTLGGGATRLIDLAHVFATVAHYGERPAIQSILRVSDYKGNDLPVACDIEPCEREQVLDPRVSYQLIDILKDNNARAPEFGQFSSLLVSNHPEVAVKTGTSNDFRDNLTIGFSQKYLTAAWVGNNDNSPMNRIASGITGAAPIWNEIMKNLLAKEPSLAWNIPDGLKQISCRVKNEFFLKETDTRNLCNIKEGTLSAQVINH